MKKVLLLVFAAIFFASCSKNIKEEAETIIKEDVTANIENAESYEILKTLVDSAYTPIDNPELYKLFDKYNETSEETKKHIAMLTEKGNILGRHTDRYSEEVSQGMEPILKSIENSVSVMENMERLINMEPMFVGYKVMHVYNIKDKNGRTVTNETMYMFDKDMTTIVYKMPYKEYVFKSIQLREAKETLKTNIDNMRKLIEEVE